MAELVTPDDKFPGLPHIDPDPRIQVTDWTAGAGVTVPEQQFNTNARRAFIQALIARHPIATIAELQEATRRRFGAVPGHHTITKDLREINVVRVPIPGLGQRFKLASQYNKVNIEDELNERARIDVLSVTRFEDRIHLEVNRGTAVALVQLFNLIYDDASRPGITAVSSDGDKWVVLYLESGKTAMTWEAWLKAKLY
jgi:arginine repressor